jgi:hypothetical protein
MAHEHKISDTLKSRLVQRFRELIADTRHTWVESAAASLHQNTPFHTIEDMLQQAFQWRGQQTPEERISGLEASLKLAGVKLDDAVPLIAPLMNIAVPPSYIPPRTPPEQQRKRLLATIASWAAENRYPYKPRHPPEGKVGLFITSKCAEVLSRHAVARKRANTCQGYVQVCETFSICSRSFIARSTIRLCSCSANSSSAVALSRVS